MHSLKLKNKSADNRNQGIRQEYYFSFTYIVQCFDPIYEGFDGVSYFEYKTISVFLLMGLIFSTCRVMIYWRPIQYNQIKEYNY